MIKIKKLVSIFVFFALSLYAQDNKEINIYTGFKYKADYNKLTSKQKTDISKEYSEIEKLVTKVYNETKNNPYYSVKKNLLILESWSNIFMSNYIPNDNELKEIYKNNEFKKNPKFKLKTLTLTDEKRALSIETQLKNKKSKDARTRLFNIFVKKDSIDTKTKDINGDLGWIDFEKINPNLKSQLIKLNANDFFRINNKNNIQFFYVEDKVDIRKATFEESKQVLIKIVKQQALRKEIEKLVK